MADVADSDPEWEPGPRLAKRKPAPTMDSESVLNALIDSDYEYDSDLLNPIPKTKKKLPSKKEAQTKSKTKKVRYAAVCNSLGMSQKTHRLESVYVAAETASLISKPNLHKPHFGLHSKPNFWFQVMIKTN